MSSLDTEQQIYALLTKALNQSFEEGRAAGFAAGASSRELVCTRCGFSAPLFAPGGAKSEPKDEAMKNHYEVCPAIKQIRVEDFQKQKTEGSSEQG